MIKDALKYSLSNLWNRKTRSFLTVISILIGVTAIVTLSSFGLGIRSFMEDMGKQMGTDKIMIMPKDYMTALGGSNVVFTQDDLDFLKKIKGVGEITGMLFSFSKVKFKDYKEIYPAVSGMSTDTKEKRLVEELFVGFGLEKGRALKKGDVLKATLGYNYLIPNKVFKKPVSVGDKIEINDIEVDVVGFYEEIGNPADDINVYLSLEGYKEIFEKEDYFYVLLRSAPDQNPTELADKIKEKFRKFRGQEKGEEDFFAQTYEQMMETFNNILNILVGILVLIALVSVVVAAVNMMNTMHTSVLERTKEIGIMKAVGAKNSDIALIFLIESGLIGLVGGILGVAVGGVFSKLAEFGASAAGYGMIKAAFPLYLILGSLLFSFVVGVLSGTIPALRAAKLKPVEALRYE